MNIFEYLGIASVEKIHTQILYWLLNDEKIPKRQKIKLINELFNTDLKNENIKVEAISEIDRIDLLIETDNDVFILENKLKSSEHDDQTVNYQAPLPYRNKNVHSCYLTLINEVPKNKKYVNKTYKELFLYIYNIEKHIIFKLKTYIFLKEYRLCIQRLTNVLELFLKNHEKYPTVFTDGYKSKSNKNKYSDQIQDYIRRNNLETIFQKAFFRLVITELKLNQMYEIDINESNGNALIQINIDAIQYKNIKLVIGFQFQNNSFKINIASSTYNSSEKDEIIGLYEYFKKNI